MFRPGDVVARLSDGVEMVVARVLGPGLYRCEWTTERGDIGYSHNDEFEERELTRVAERDERDNRRWRAPDAC